MKEENTTNEEETIREKSILQVNRLNFFYGAKFSKGKRVDGKQALFDINMNIRKHAVTALIGPSGCGKSTFLRCFNRMNDLIENTHAEGEILFNSENILEPKRDVIDLRRRIGMVFQKSNPFPKSIFENVVYGLKIAGEKRKNVLQEACESSLQRAALWGEVKDKLHHSALELSGGQMQRLCIARAIAVKPDIILMDEPCSALDPRSTIRIEDLIRELRRNYTIIIVTHNMQQASRISKYTAFFNLGVLVEIGETADIFTNPGKKDTQDYITGRFG